VRDLIAGLIKRAHIEQTDEDGPIVVYAVHNNRIYRELDLDYAVISISDVTALVAQRIPPEEAAADASELIQVFHFQGEPSKSHGYPFRFLLKKVRPHGL
jgi:ubiquitin carboxyl-terminal hydrolase 7